MTVVVGAVALTCVDALASVGEGLDKLDLLRTFCGPVCRRAQACACCGQQARAPATDVGEPPESLLDAADDEYLRAAATTQADLATLAPKVTHTVRDAVHDADPTLDADVAAWFADGCPLPRLSLLGPVRARTRGTPLIDRKPHMTEVLTYIATRPHGATPEELADALGITLGKARDYAGIVRAWLGSTPAPATTTCPTPDSPQPPRPRGWAPTRYLTSSSTPTSSDAYAPEAKPAAPTASPTSPPPCAWSKDNPSTSAAPTAGPGSTKAIASTTTSPLPSST